MKFQLAIDTLNMKETISMVKLALGFIDIVEVGTPLLMRTGLGIIPILKKKFPTLEILADMKIADAGRYEVQMASEAGADYVTVLGVSSKSTLIEAISAAHEKKIKILVDMIASPDISTNIKQVIGLKPDYIGIHTAFDDQDCLDPVEDLKTATGQFPGLEIAVAGGLNEISTAKAVLYKPSIIIIGGAVTSSKNPLAVIRALHKIIHGEP